MLLWTSAYKYLFEPLLSILLGIYLVVELLDHVEILCLTLEEPLNFSTAAKPILHSYQQYTGALISPLPHQHLFSLLVCGGMTFCLLFVVGKLMILKGCITVVFGLSFPNGYYCWASFHFFKKYILGFNSIAVYHLQIPSSILWVYFLLVSFDAQKP